MSRSRPLRFARLPWLLMVLVLDQVVSLREQIKRRQQGLDNGKEVRAAGWGSGAPRGAPGLLSRLLLRLRGRSQSFGVLVFHQRLPNGPSAILDNAELERQRDGEIERQRSELGQLKERLALMCRQVGGADGGLLRGSC